VWVGVCENRLLGESCKGTGATCRIQLPKGDFKGRNHGGSEPEEGGDLTRTLRKGRWPDVNAQKRAITERRDSSPIRAQKREENKTTARRRIKEDVWGSAASKVPLGGNVAGVGADRRVGEISVAVSRGEPVVQRKTGFVSLQTPSLETKGSARIDRKKANSLDFCPNGNRRSCEGSNCNISKRPGEAKWSTKCAEGRKESRKQKRDVAATRGTNYNWGSRAPALFLFAKRITKKRKGVRIHLNGVRKNSKRPSQANIPLEKKKRLLPKKGLASET